MGCSMGCSAFSRGLGGPSWNSYAECPQKPGRKPVICVAGLASSALEGKITNWQDFVDKAPEHAVRRLKSHPTLEKMVETRKPEKKHSVTYCSVEALTTQPATTLHSLVLAPATGRLKSGAEVPCTKSVPGIEMRPVQGMAGIRTLNPGEAIPVNVWKGFSDALQDGFNLNAFNYDWRRWGDEVYAEEMVENFKRTVEKHVHASGPKAAVVGHSMGCPVILYCLSKLGDEWTRAHFDNVFLVAPAHMGSPSMIPSLAHGPVGATHTFIPAPDILSHDIADITASWACMAAEMPVRVGGLPPWDEAHEFVITPTTTYTLKDMGKFLKTLAESKDNREIPTAIWPGVERLYGDIRPPAVPLQIIYGDGVDTISQVEYTSDDFKEPPEIKSNEKGDGTIVAGSVEKLADAWVKQGASVTLHKVEGEISHKDLIACEPTAEILHKVLGTQKSSTSHPAESLPRILGNQKSGMSHKDLVKKSG